MWSSLRSILQEETTEFATGLDIEDNGKEGTKDGSQVSGLNNFWDSVGKDGQIQVDRYHDFFFDSFFGHTKFTMSLTCLGGDVKNQSIRYLNFRFSDIHRSQGQRYMLGSHEHEDSI